MKLKTNIMCGACIEKVTPVLDQVLGKGNWNVDTSTPQKILTIATVPISQSEVIQAVEKAGYKAELVD